MALQVIAPARGTQARLSQFGMAVPQMAGVGPMNVVDPVGGEIKKLSAQISAYLAKKKQTERAADLADATTELTKSAMAYQSAYRQNNMGRMARNAADDFAANVNEAAEKIRERFKGDNELDAMFMQKAGELSMRSYAGGFSYAEREEEKYRADTAKEKLSLFTSAIGTGTEADIAASKQDYMDTLATMYPGRNLNADIMELNRIEAGGMIERSLSSGDIRGAKAFYEKNRESLGKSAPSFLARIKNAQEAQERKWEAERNKAGRDILKGYGDAMYKATNFGDYSALEGMEKGLRSLGLSEDADRIKAEAGAFRESSETLRSASFLSMPEAGMKLAELDAGILSAMAEGDVKKHRRLSTLREALAGQIRQRASAMEKDPAKAASLSPAMQLPDNATMEDVASLRMDWQMKNGIPEDRRAPLTKEEVQGMGMEYAKSADPVQYLSGMKESFGSMYQSAMQQLVSSGAMPVSASLVADMDASAGKMLAEASRKDYVKNTEEVLGMDSAAKNEAKGKIRDALEDILGTLAASGSAAEGKVILDSAYSLALRYREAGMDAGDAEEKAANDVFLGRYAVNGSYRVPKNYLAENVSLGTEAYLQSMDVLSIDAAMSGDYAALSAKDREDMMRRTLLRSGRWITNSDESGLVLTLGGKAVKLNGKLVNVPFAELESLGMERNSGMEEDE